MEDQEKEFTEGLIKVLKKANEEVLLTVLGLVLFGEKNEGYPLSEENADFVNFSIKMFSSIGGDNRMTRIIFDSGISQKDAISNYRVVQATLKEMKNNS